MVELNDRIALALYAGIGLGFISLLHGFYIQYTGRNPRFSFPFTELGTSLTPIYGYFGSIITGAVTTWVIWIMITAARPNQLTDVGELQPILLPGTLVIVMLVGLAQFATGASYSKLALHGLVLGVTGIALLMVVRPFTLPEIITTYVSVLAFLLVLGNLWVQYIDDFQFPHLPSVAYFTLSALYILVGSLFLLSYVVE